jgi:FkbM family methyltransferase
LAEATRRYHCRGIRVEVFLLGVKLRDPLWLGGLAVLLFFSIRFLQPAQGYRRTIALALDHTLAVQEPCVIPPGRSFQISYFGLLYSGNTSNLIDQRVLCLGAWEKHILRFLGGTSLNLNDSDLVFIDIGANTGLHTLFMSKYARQVHAFDPYPPVVEQLRTNVSSNHLENVVVHAVGLGDEPARVPFLEPPEDNNGTGSFAFDSKTVSNRSLIELQIVAGDEYFAAHGIDRVDLVKIDVEGYEKSVLRGLRQTIRSQRPIVVMELSINDEDEELFTSYDEFTGAFPENYGLFAFRSWNAWTGSYELGPLNADFFASNYKCDLVAAPIEKLDRLAGSNAGEWR